MAKNNPVTTYLNSLAPSGRRAALSQLNMLRLAMEWDEPTVEQPFHCLTYAQIESLKGKMLIEGKSYATINHAIQVVKGVMKSAYLLERIDHKTLMRIRSVSNLKGSTQEKGKALDKKMVDQLLRELETKTSWVGQRDLAIFAILLGTGVRRSELCSLNIDDYCLESQAIIVRHGKGNKARCQFLPFWAARAVELWLALRGYDPGSLFLRQGAGIRRLSSDGLYRLVTKRTEDILGKRFTPHDMRRTYITQLLNSGVDVLTVSKMAGHANVNTTQIYDRRDIEAQRRAAEALMYHGGEQ